MRSATAPAVDARWSSSGSSRRVRSFGTRLSRAGALSGALAERRGAVSSSRQYRAWCCPISSYPSTSEPFDRPQSARFHGSGSGSPDAGDGSPDAGEVSFCGATDLFHGECGGSVSGSGTTPLGSPFAPTAVYVAVGSTCGSAGSDRYVQYIEIAYGPAHDFARLTFTDDADGGAGGGIVFAGGLSGGGAAWSPDGSTNDNGLFSA